MPGIWVYQGCQYASGSQYARVLNLPVFLVCQGSEDAAFTEGPEYAWIIPQIYPIMPDYAWIYWNKPKSAWMSFVFMSPL